MVIYSVKKRSSYNWKSVRENEDKIYLDYERIMNNNMSQMDSMYVKEIFYNIDHNEIYYDPNRENGYERKGYKNILNES